MRIKFKSKRKKNLCYLSRAMPHAASALLGIVNFFQLLRNETVAIGHLNFRQRFGVDDVFFLDDVIAIQHESDEGINFVCAQRSFLIARHVAAAIIKNGCRKWPETSAR